MTPYQRIVRAARRGTGVRLSAADAVALARDEAILAVARGDDERDQMAPDERDHDECFLLKHGSLSRGLADTCDGDGWYGCKDCARWTGKKGE